MPSHGIKRLSFLDTVPNPREASKTLEVDVTDVEIEPHGAVGEIGLMLLGPKRRVLVPWGNIRAVEYQELQPATHPEPTPAPTGGDHGRRLPKT